MPTIAFQGTRAELRALLAKIPGIINGSVPDPQQLRRRLQTRIGVALLSSIQTDFVTKSRGGTGQDGIKWKPMLPSSIASRRITAGEKKAAGIKGKRVRGLLTPAQDKRWRKIYATRRAWLIAKGEGAGEASAHAARIAWATLKNEGALTRLAVFGGRQVDICRDTSMYFRSLSPGVEDKPYSGADADQQVFELPGSSVIVGTRVPYAGRQHAMRPLWPTDGSIPPRWWEAIHKAAVRGVVRVVMFLVAGVQP